MVTSELLAVRRKIFQDYTNHRDRIKKLTENPLLVLTPAQERQLIVAARKSYRQREWTGTSNWLISFFREAGQYFGSLKIKDWPSFRNR